MYGICIAVHIPIKRMPVYGNPYVMIVTPLLAVFKVFIWGGIWSDVWSEILFYGYVLVVGEPEIQKLEKSGRKVTEF